MKVVVINGTEVKGCTYNIKEAFIKSLTSVDDIISFCLPRDIGHFCTGCKICFFKNESLCPHAQMVSPIWQAMLESDLIVFAYPVYALRTPGHVKALLDHLCCHWMVHRPEEAMFSKKAVILTNSIGAPNRQAQKDVSTSLTWLGVSDIKTLGIGLMEGVIWEELSAKKREDIILKVNRLANKYNKTFVPSKKSMKIKILFNINRMLHSRILKGEVTPSADNLHWINKGWIKQ